MQCTLYHVDILQLHGNTNNLIIITTCTHANANMNALSHTLVFTQALKKEKSGKFLLKESVFTAG
jgi:hypothetical protein